LSTASPGFKLPSGGPPDIARMTQTAAAAAAPGLRVCSHGLASGKLDRLRDKGGAGKPAGAGVGPGWSSPHRSEIASWRNRL